MTVDEVQDDLRRYLSDYLAVRELKKSVEKRLKDLEKERARRPRDRKIRHSISGLRSTLRTLENRKEVILRTLNARLARSIGTITMQNIELQPHEYHVSVNGKDRVAVYKIVEEEDDVSPLKILIKIPRIELSRAEELLSLMDEIVRLFKDKVGLPVKIHIDKLVMSDSELDTAVDVLRRRGFRISKQGRKFTFFSE